MGDNVKALKALYVALGGSSETVESIASIADMINAIATQAAVVVSAANAKELPTDPTANGTYLLQCVKSNAGATKSWEAKVG